MENFVPRYAYDASMKLDAGKPFELQLFAHDKYARMEWVLNPNYNGINGKKHLYRYKGHNYSEKGYAAGAALADLGIKFACFGCGKTQENYGSMSNHQKGCIADSAQKTALNQLAFMRVVTDLSTIRDILSMFIETEEVKIPKLNKIQRECMKEAFPVFFEPNKDVIKKIWKMIGKMRADKDAKKKYSVYTIAKDIASKSLPTNRVVYVGKTESISKRAKEHRENVRKWSRDKSAIVCSITKHMAHQLTEGDDFGMVEIVGGLSEVGAKFVERILTDVFQYLTSEMIENDISPCAFSSGNWTKDEKNVGLRLLAGAAVIRGFKQFKENNGRKFDITPVAWPSMNTDNTVDVMKNSKVRSISF